MAAPLWPQPPRTLPTRSSTSPQVAFYRIDPHRSTETFLALLDDWEGILVSDGYGVSQHWVAQRHTCLGPSHPASTGLGPAAPPEVAACGTRVLAALQRLCPMAHSPPTGGQWRAWYARLCGLLTRSHDRHDDAGQLLRHLLREHGVEPTTNRAERALRFAVLWRKRSQGTARDKGARWVERLLSRKETCRLQAQSTYAVLVDARRSFFHGHLPELSWL